MAQFGPAQLLLPDQDLPVLKALDIDGDGDLDLVGHFGAEFKWAANIDGEGTLGPFQTMLATGAILDHAIADVDLDGESDLVYVDASDALRISMGLGNGTFAAPIMLQYLPGPVGAIAVADISADGYPEIIASITQGGNARITIIPNLNGSFGPNYLIPPTITGAPPSIVLAADFDGNGGNDILFINANNSAIGLMNVNGNGSEWQQMSLFDLFVNPLTDPQLIDVDGDGDLDIAEAAPVVVQWVENRLDEQIPFNAFTVQQIEPMPTAGIGAFAHLGCGDGVSVVYVPSDPSLPVRWRTYLTSTQSFAPRRDLLDIPRGNRILLADMDGDGRPDLLIGNDTGLSLFLNELTPPTTQVELPALDTVCLAGPSIPLPDAIPSGGTWSGTWVMNNVFHRSSVGTTANVPLSYTSYEPEGCPVGGITTIRVITGPTISPFLGPVVCSGDGPFQMTSLPEATEWSGLSEGNVLDLEEYSGDQIVAAYTDNTGTTCVSFMGPLNVWNTIPTEIIPAGPFCVNDGMQIILPGSSWTNSTWSGDIAGTSGEGALFDPSQGAGSYTIILARNPTAPQQCANSDTLIVNVSDDIPQVELVAPPAYCASTSAIDLDMAQPVGGEWAGPGVTGDVMLPFFAGPGDHVLTYTVNDPGGCSTTAEMILTLASTVTITRDDGGALFFCVDEGPVDLLAHPQGGEWSEPVSPEGVFDPGAAGAGEHEVVYVYTDPNGCMLVNPPADLVVQEMTQVMIDPVGMVCLEDPPFEITGTPGGIWSGAVSGEGASVIFDPGSLGLGTWPVSLTAEAEGTCPTTVSEDVIIEVCTGIAAADNGSSISIAPNPASGMVVLSIQVTGPIQLEIFDATGRRVIGPERFPANTTSVPLDLSALASGLYHLQVLHGEELVQLKVLKQ